MVELRKRPPPKEPAAPPPAAKKGRASASSSKAKPAAAAKNESTITSKVKATAAKVKEAVAGPLASNEQDAAKNESALEPGAAVEKGEAGMIPETAGTAPSTTTIPGAAAGASTAPVEADPNTATAADASKADEHPPATEDLEKPVEKGKIDASAPAPADEASLPLATSSVGKSLPVATLPSAANLETHSGRKITIAELFSHSTTAGGGVIIFTYPRASTPGCTQQACMFRDNHAQFTAAGGYKVYGLSTDSAKANANFVAKQKLQYELLCDPDAVLTGLLGMKKPGNAKGTLRGVVVVGADGKVKLWFQGGPAKTVDVVKEFLAGA